MPRRDRAFPGEKQTKSMESIGHACVWRGVSVLPAHLFSTSIAWPPGLEQGEGKIPQPQLMVVTLWEIAEKKKY